MLGLDSRKPYFKDYHTHREELLVIWSKKVAAQAAYNTLNQQTTTRDHMRTILGKKNPEKDALFLALQDATNNFTKQKTLTDNSARQLPGLFRCNSNEIRLLEQQISTIEPQINFLLGIISELQSLIENKKTALLAGGASEIGDLLIKKGDTKNEKIISLIAEGLSTLLSGNALSTSEINQKVLALQDGYNSLQSTFASRGQSLEEIKISRVPNLAFVEYADLISSFLPLKKDYVSMLSLGAQGLTAYRLRDFSTQLSKAATLLQDLKQKITNINRSLEIVLLRHKERDLHKGVF